MSSSSSSSSNSKPMLKVKRSGGGLQGPRPQPLSLPTTVSLVSLARPSKKPRISDNHVGAAPAGPVIIYDDTPKAVHVRPDEFMAVVQRLTGQQRPGHLQVQAELPRTEVALAPAVEEETATTTDHLVRALGQQEALVPLDNFLVLPSPGPVSDGGFLLSPGTFLFSPATMQAIQEMIS